MRDSKIVERIKNSDTVPGKKKASKLISKKQLEKIGVAKMPSSGGMRVADLERRNEGTGVRDGGRGPDNVKMVTYMQKSHFYNPMSRIGDAIRRALDPEEVKKSLPPKVKTLADMTDEEKEKIMKRTGAKICGQTG